MACRAILLDMDGVMIDSEPIITHAAANVLRARGIPAKEEDFRAFTGMGEDEFIGGVARKYGFDYIESMKTEAYQLYEQYIQTKSIAFPQLVTALLVWRQAGIKVAVASSADRTKVEMNLRAIPMREDQFQAVVTGSDVENKKPAPDIYLEAARRLSVAPEQCIVIEDATAGVEAGVKAGMTVIGLATSFSKQQLLDAGAAHVCAHWGEILTVWDKQR